MGRRFPSRAFMTRENHRKWLTAHFILCVAGISGAFIANRTLTPTHFWAHWIALGWGAVFALHLIVFSRATLATMGGRRF